MSLVCVCLCVEVFSTSIDPDSIDKYAKRDAANSGELLLLQYQAQIAASLRQALATGKTKKKKKKKKREKSIFQIYINPGFFYLLIRAPKLV